MTTLRSFQHDIDEIHSREIAKQRGLHDKEKPVAIAMGKGKVKDEETGAAGLASSERADPQEGEEDTIVCPFLSTAAYPVFNAHQRLFSVRRKQLIMRSPAIISQRCSPGKVASACSDLESNLPVQSSYLVN